ncbi:MAG: MFS transporter, partial [Anaerolineales bacterium]
MRQNQRNMLILFFTMIVIMLGFGIVIPILPFYVKQFGAGGSALGMLMATYGLMQFIFAPIWGSISDQIGRKPILMVGVFGNALAQLLLGLSTQLWMLFIARALAGILSSATLPTAMAYVSDSTNEEERGGKMGMIGAAMGIGMVIGPGLGGWLANSSLSAPFFLASGLSFFALIIVFLVLPEVPRRAPKKDIRIRGPQIQNLWKALKGPIGILLWMAFLLSFGLTNFESVFGLYAKERYNYTPQQV